MDDIDAFIQICCARNIRWMLGEVILSDHAISINGWAIPFAVAATSCHFFLNGAPFSEQDWPLPSPDVAEVFPFLHSSGNARFFCRHDFESLSEVFQDGFARFDFSRGVPHSRSYRSAWYYPDPRLDRGPLPESARIARVVGSPRVDSYLYGGASLFKRIEVYLSEAMQQNLSNFKNILDWGCGAGRLTRYLVGLRDSLITGCDIDVDNIRWCQNNITGAYFQVTNLLPPTTFENGCFDLIIGCSVFTHLEKEAQFAWLDELRRIAAPGGLILASIQGPSQGALYKMSAEMYCRIEAEGFLDVGINAQLDGFVQEGYYRNVIQSRDYILREWGEYFAILDIVDGIATNQDFVVMRRR